MATVLVSLAGWIAFAIRSLGQHIDGLEATIDVRIGALERNQAVLIERTSHLAPIRQQRQR